VRSSISDLDRGVSGDRGETSRRDRGGAEQQYHSAPSRSLRDVLSAIPASGYRQRAQLDRVMQENAAYAVWRTPQRIMNARLLKVSGQFDF
jgi:hypothetical protein